MLSNLGFKFYLPPQQTKRLIFVEKILMTRISVFIQEIMWSLSFSLTRFPGNFPNDYTMIMAIFLELYLYHARLKIETSQTYHKVL